MLKGKRVVITGGGRDFGRALSLLMAREGAQVDVCARRRSAAEETCLAIREEGGLARAFECDVGDPASIRAFAAALAEHEAPVDILLLSAAQWLEGDLGVDDNDEDIVSTIASGLTGAILLTKALLPSLRRAPCADIVAMISVCGQPGFLQSNAHPAFYAAKHGMAGFCDILRQRLRQEDIRVTGLYPPDFATTEACEQGTPAQGRHGELLHASSIWNALRYVLSQPRNCHVSSIHFDGPTRAELGQ